MRARASRPHPSRKRIVVLAMLVATLVAAGCTSGDEAATRRRRTSPPPTTGDAPAPDESAPPEGGDAPADALAPEASLPPNVFSGVTTAPPIPTGAFEIALSGALSGKGAGDPRIRCLKGPAYFDVDIAADPPLTVGGDLAVSSMTFGLGRFRGPGRYDAADADDAEWSVGLVDLTNGFPFEYYSPLEGAGGGVTIGPDGRSGRFDISGLVGDEGGVLAVEGSFTCGAVEQ